MLLLFPSLCLKDLDYKSSHCHLRRGPECRSLYLLHAFLIAAQIPRHYRLSVCSKETRVVEVTG
jgi:hypothetical protein